MRRTAYCLLLTAYFLLTSCQPSPYFSHIAESTRLFVSDSLGNEQLLEQYHLISIEDHQITINEKTYPIFDMQVGFNTVHYIPYNTAFYFIYVPMRELHEVAYFDNCINRTYLVKSIHEMSIIKKTASKDE